MWAGRYLADDGELPQVPLKCGLAVTWQTTVNCPKSPWNVGWLLAGWHGKLPQVPLKCGLAVTWQTTLNCPKSPWNVIWLLPGRRRWIASYLQGRQGWDSSRTCPAGCTAPANQINRSGWVVRSSAWANFATVLGSIPASSDTVEFFRTTYET
jgi:hypothetical protein